MCSAGKGTCQVKEGSQQDLLSQGTTEVSGTQYEPTGRLVQKALTKDRVLRKSPYAIVCNLCPFYLLYLSEFAVVFSHVSYSVILSDQ